MLGSAEGSHAPQETLQSYYVEAVGVSMRMSLLRRAGMTQGFPVSTFPAAKFSVYADNRCSTVSAAGEYLSAHRQIAYLGLSPGFGSESVACRI